MMLYKNNKAMVHPPDSDTKFFDFVTGILQWYILVTYKDHWISLHTFFCMDTFIDSTHMKL